MSMDAHARFRTEAHTDVQPRFNERFLLSLASCRACLVLDDELNLLPISSHASQVTTASAHHPNDRPQPWGARGQENRAAPA